MLSIYVLALCLAGVVRAQTAQVIGCIKFDAIGKYTDPDVDDQRATKPSDCVVSELSACSPIHH